MRYGKKNMWKNMTHNNCPDCNGELTKIKLFGRGWENPISGVAIDADIGFYAEGDGERNGFSSMFKPKGGVESYPCNACGRLFLFSKEKQ
jgi:hypothetical protein